MRHQPLPPVGTFEAWRDAARALLLARVTPEEVSWSMGEVAPDLFARDSPLPDAEGTVTVPREFLQLARQAVWHRDPERFARLYTLLWRVQCEKRLIGDRGDPLVAKLNAMAKEVGRDKHKMTAFVRFRETGDPAAPRRQFAAWFEPTHFIVEPTAPFFAKRFGDMDWSIFTPDLSVHFDGTLNFAECAAKPPFPEDATEDLWRTYFRNIFNPSRLMPKAMQSEMPKKYWKNMPEAGLIPELITTAPARARAMAEAMPTIAPARAARVGEAVRQAQALREAGQDAFEVALAGCRRCPLWENATQAVPGEGPLDARLMFVGEQPGDREDLTGRPFVGPAGQLFDETLEGAGIDRDKVYVTNAVKHFKFVPRGKRRLHQNPNRDEIEHCKWWLGLERERVQPELIVAMGGTALESLTGSRRDILKRRGGVEALGDGTPLFVTVHPSFILRIPDRVRQEEERDRFRADLERLRSLTD
ncbi:UdgX family uracil-DNA binding protein [Maritimibacter sp. DP1N21-5]|uniref:UdgX family uracil-DNA binding protein n=1 Tax=Maritimibacter sp. DP1N21-5 TaxID=2836867 RepID=UPI001C442619|nr:UdgX family uracil-DNA binding protein [Maritimibacter sp. DP1N21-5]MBV7408570.1 UdgX family uracil-DNA binding protein [Maritimibacter sp. DP1N21-5]